MEAKRYTSLAVLILLILGILLLPTGTARSAQEVPLRNKFRVWMKVKPCSPTRLDWITVARENPTQTPNVYVPSPLSAGRSFDTLAAALAQASSDMIFITSGESSGMPKFENYCCDNFSVWRDAQTRATTVLTGKLDQPGFGNLLKETPDLCGERAFALAGLFGPFTDLSLPNGSRVRFTERGFVSLSGRPITIGGVVIPAMPAGQGGAISGPGGSTGLINQPGATPPRRVRPKVEELPIDAEKPRSSGSKPPASQPTPPTKPPAGSLQEQPVWIKPSKEEGSFRIGGITKYAFTATAVTMSTDTGTEQYSVKWQFAAQGMQGSLRPGQEITIIITGEFAATNPQKSVEPPYTAGVDATGVEVISAQNAHVNKTRKREGKYVFKVPANATTIRIAFWGDYGIGTFARYCYGECK
jgi:hypothetical protein